MLKKLARFILYSPPVAAILCNRVMQPAWLALQKLSLYGMNYGGGNTVNQSGELWVLKRIGKALRGTPNPVVLDVGASVGDYAEAVRKVVGENVRLFCFEPSPTAFAVLKSNFATTPGVSLNNLGLSNSEGTATLWSNAEGSVVSSIHPGETTVAPTMNRTEECRVTTLDRFCEENSLSHIDFLKIDCEGNEHNILLGAKQLIAAEGIDYIQFEFGPPQINARSFFRDLFKLLEPQYRIYRILRSGLAPIDTYEEIQEVFRTTNYLAVSRRLGGKLR